MYRQLGLLGVIAFFLGATGHQALAANPSGDPAGSVQVRLRGVAVLPSPSANIVISGASIGGKTQVSDSFVPEADITYFITSNIAVEAIAAVTQHSVSNSVAGRVASVWLLPPTVTAQYHFDPNGPVRPYIGAGINYTVFFDARSALPNLSFANNVGWALQGGVDVPLGEGPYFLNLDVKKLFLSTTIKAAGGAVHASADLNPWLVGAGVGFRF
jgi:outer membrane protein